MKIKNLLSRANVNLYFALSFCLCIFAVDGFPAYQSGEISGEVDKIIYKQYVNDSLDESKLENLDFNRSAGAFILSSGKEKIAVSRWILPKRTRSYPYERVYDTLAFAGRKVTIIPVVKDEGTGGERDFLQWDTISLLSLLDVHLVLACYDSAEKNTKRPDQITQQKFDNVYITARLNEIYNFKGTARECNERETKQLKAIFEKARLAYRKISKDTKTYLHDETALERFDRLRCHAADVRRIFAPQIAESPSPRI